MGATFSLCWLVGFEVQILLCLVPFRQFVLSHLSRTHRGNGFYSWVNDVKLVSGSSENFIFLTESKLSQSEIILPRRRLKLAINHDN